MRPLRGSQLALRPRRRATSKGSKRGNPLAPPASARWPQHWIGIRKDWREFTADPISALVSVSAQDLATSALVLGSTGSGKTVFILHLIARDILAGHGLVVLDYRGDLVLAVLQMLAGRVHPSRIAFIDLRDGASTGFDPLYGSGPAYVRALGLLAALEAEYGVLGIQLSETLRNLFVLLAESGQPLTRLETVLYDDAYRASLVERSKNDSVRDYWIRYSEMSKEKQTMLAMPANNKVSLMLASPSLREILGNANPIDLGDHLNKPGTVTLVSIAVDQLSGAGRLVGSVALSSICREIFARADVDQADRCPQRLYVDEFSNFMEQDASFRSILAEARKYRFSVVVAAQVFSQLSPTMRSLLLNGVGLKAFFRTGRDDSSLISKDLTGDLKALDLTMLPPGEAYLWRRSQGLVHLEVNRPLLLNKRNWPKDVQRLTEQIRKHWASRGTVRTNVDEPSGREPERPQPHSRNAQTVEDWLL